MLLKGEHIPITTEALQAIQGKEIVYLTTGDIDTSGRGYFFPRNGVIEEIYRKTIIMENGEYISMSDMREVVVDKGWST